MSYQCEGQGCRGCSDCKAANLLKLDNERLHGALRHIAAMQCRRHPNTECLDRDPDEVHPQWWCHSCQARAALAGVSRDLEHEDRRHPYEDWIDGIDVLLSG